MNKFQGDWALQASIDSAIDACHSSACEARLNTVAPINDGSKQRIQHIHILKFNWLSPFAAVRENACVCEGGVCAREQCCIRGKACGISAESF